MIEDLKREALELQLAKIGPNTPLTTIFPDSMELTEVVGFMKMGVERLGVLEQKTVAYMMALGRLMDIASQRKHGEWEGTGYTSFTNFQELELAKLKSNGARWDALKIYRNFKDVPMEDLEQCGLGNLRQAAKICEGGASDSQKAELVQMAKKPAEEFKHDVEKAGMLAGGEAFSGILTLKGSRGKVDELRHWLDRQDVEDAGHGGYVERLLAATAEYDSSGPSAMRAVVILRSIAARAEQMEKWDLVIDEDGEREIKQWLAQSTPTVERVVDTTLADE